MAKIDAFFKLMKEQGASDLHLISGSQPILIVFLGCIVGSIVVAMHLPIFKMGDAV